MGKEAVYEIRVTNQGTGACTNVQLVAALAEGTDVHRVERPDAGEGAGPAPGVRADRDAAR